MLQYTTQSHSSTGWDTKKNINTDTDTECKLDFTGSIGFIYYVLLSGRNSEGDLRTVVRVRGYEFIDVRG